MNKNKLWTNAGAVLFAAMLLTAGALLAQDKAPAKGQSKTFEGVVTDAMCGAGHSMMGNIPDKQCVLGCVKGGSKYALIVGKKVYTLDGKPADFEKFAAAKVTVTGTLSGDTLRVESITAAAGK
jgi:hypothetical protein